MVWVVFAARRECGRAPDATGCSSRIEPPGRERVNAVRRGERAVYTPRMSILICGSLAYDTIMVFQGQFKKHILPDQLHILNVAFMVPDMRREFGGTAGNVAYNLRLLGEEAMIMATVGHDFKPYAQRLEKLGISTRHVRKLDGQFTAQAFITTDIDDNQITAFHPGAMSDSQVN